MARPMGNFPRCPPTSSAAHARATRRGATHAARNRRRLADRCLWQLERRTSPRDMQQALSSARSEIGAGFCSAVLRGMRGARARMYNSPTTQSEAQASGISTGQSERVVVRIAIKPTSSILNEVGNPSRQLCGSVGACIQVGNLCVGFGTPCGCGTRESVQTLNTTVELPAWRSGADSLRCPVIRSQ